MYEPTDYRDEGQGFVDKDHDIGTKHWHWADDLIVIKYLRRALN